MFDLSDYDKESVEASRAVLVEALTVLNRYRNDIVIVGGWVPELTFPGKGHIGSIDADLAIRPQLAMENAYTTIRKLLLDAGYEQKDRTLPNRFERSVTIGGKKIPVKLDLITGDQGDANRPEMIQDLPVAKLRGVNLAFGFSTTVQVEGTLPDGGFNRIVASLTDARAYIAMKGITMWERKKEKDAYDIYFSLRHLSDDTDALAGEFRKVLDHPLVGEGLSKIRAKFSTIEDIGPVWASQVIQQQAGDRELAQRDAFERVDALMNALAIQPWADKSAWDPPLLDVILHPPITFAGVGFDGPGLRKRLHEEADCHAVEFRKLLHQIAGHELLALMAYLPNKRPKSYPTNSEVFQLSNRQITISCVSYLTLNSQSVSFQGSMSRGGRMPVNR